MKYINPDTVPDRLFPHLHRMPNFYSQLLLEVGVVAHVQNMAMPQKVQLFRGGRVVPSFSTQAEFLAPKTDLKNKAK